MFFVIFFKIVDRPDVYQRVLKLTEFYVKVEKTGIRQYNLAIISTSFCSIEIKKITDRRS